MPIEERVELTPPFTGLDERNSRSAHAAREEVIPKLEDLVINKFEPEILRRMCNDWKAVVGSIRFMYETGSRLDYHRLFDRFAGYLEDVSGDTRPRHGVLATKRGKLANVEMLTEKMRQIINSSPAITERHLVVPDISIVPDSLTITEPTNDAELGELFFFAWKMRDWELQKMVYPFERELIIATGYSIENPPEGEQIVPFKYGRYSFFVHCMPSSDTDYEAVVQELGKMRQFIDSRKIWTNRSGTHVSVDSLIEGIGSLKQDKTDDFVDFGPINYVYDMEPRIGS